MCECYYYSFKCQAAFLPPLLTASLPFHSDSTGMAGVPGTASDIFGCVKDVGANVIMISQVPFCQTSP